MKKNIYILFLAFWGCISCSNLTPKNKVAEFMQPDTACIDSLYSDCALYKELDRLGLNTFEQDARFIIYALNCEKTLECGAETMPFIAASLKLTKFKMNGDTLHFYYCVEKNNNLLCKHISCYDGITFVNRKIDALNIDNLTKYFPSISDKERIPIKDIAVLKKEQQSYEDKTGKKGGYLQPYIRALNPEQSEVIDYIKANKTKLNSWLKQAAQKRGILK